ncbi:NACHT domain-containing protein [Streptomyces sp. NPDC002589]|uniref:NACHT domain-containing protein n=1 Tax=Streptomyces sp. NPDC002589 TaxID=3154420 RepID=UPI0033192195
MAEGSGFPRKGPQRPDPATATPELRPWVALMRRVYDELYEGLDPGDRPTVTGLGAAAYLSKSYVSALFSGKRRPPLDKFLLIVTALGGDTDEWEPRWHAARMRQEAGAGEEPDRLLLPGIKEQREGADAGGDGQEAGAAPDVGSTAPGAGALRYPVRRLVRAFVAWVVMTVTWPVRARRDRHEIQMRRRLVKQVRERAAEDLGRAEAHHYLTPRFAILTEKPSEPRSAGHRRRARRARRAEFVPVPTGVTSVRALYEDTDDLVVLGSPGMGKTTQLARLAHRMAMEVLNGPDDREPPYIPVYLRLDTYRGEPIEEWLAAAMTTYEGISGLLVRTWLSEHRLLPVLDGLDEVPERDRPKCVAELRRLRRLCPGMAVGCRTDEADLRRLAQDLRALRYVEIQPPSRRDVQEFLEEDREALADVHAALEEDPELWPLFQSPMMLGFIRLTYRNRPADDLRAPGSLIERRDRIFDAYTRECLRRERPRPDDTPERTLTWLTWLARTLTARGEHVLFLDRLDLSWLSRAEGILPRIIPNVTMPFFAFGLTLVWLTFAVRAGVLHTSLRDAGALALAMAVTVGAQAYLAERHFLQIDEREDGDKAGAGRERGAIALPMMANGPVMFVLLVWLVFVVKADLTSPGCLVVGLAYLWVAVTQMEASYTDVFQPVEQLRWTWRRREYVIHSPMARGTLSVVVWIAIDCLLGYVVHLLCPNPPWIGPAAAFLMGLVYVVGNQFEPSLQDRRPRPNDGVRRTVRFFLVHGFAGLAVGGIGLIVLIGLATPDHDLRRAGFIAILLGALFAVVRGFRYGGLAVLRHWTIRAVLAYRGRTPYRYRRFLHTAEERVLLHRTDSGFFFPHRQLQLHLNTTVEELLPRLTDRATGGGARTCLPSGAGGAGERAGRDEAR